MYELDENTLAPYLNTPVKRTLYTQPFTAYRQNAEAAATAPSQRIVSAFFASALRDDGKGADVRVVLQAHEPRKVGLHRTWDGG